MEILKVEGRVQIDGGRRSGQTMWFGKEGEGDVGNDRLLTALSNSCCLCTKVMDPIVIVLAAIKMILAVLAISPPNSKEFNQLIFTKQIRLRLILLTW